MVDEVQVVSRCDCHGVTSTLHQPDVSLVESLMDIHKGIDNRLSVGRRSWELWIYCRNNIGWNVLKRRKRDHNFRQRAVQETHVRFVEVNLVGEL